MGFHGRQGGVGLAAFGGFVDGGVNLAGNERNEHEVPDPGREPRAGASEVRSNEIVGQMVFSPEHWCPISDRCLHCNSSPPGRGKQQEHCGRVKQQRHDEDEPPEHHLVGWPISVAR